MPAYGSIDALAGELALAQIAHFDRISQPAARLDLEVGENGMSWIGVGDFEVFGLRTTGS